MLKVALLNIKGEKIKDIELNDSIWGITPNDAVLYNAIILQRASQRQGTHDTKNRSEVSGGGRKPWKQKGTGRARQGSIRSPQWRGGGIVFGPTPRDYSKKMNKKERKLALYSALAYKVINNELVVIDNVNVETNKTKEMLNITKNLNVLNNKILLVVDKENTNARLSSNNLSNIKVVDYTGLSVLDITNSDNLVISYDELLKLEGGVNND